MIDPWLVYSKALKKERRGRWLRLADIHATRSAAVRC
jgi:hypothetical protein